MVKLPKQWLHWAKCAGLQPTSKRNPWAGFYLVGRGRYWRVDCLGRFECSCPIEYFDRWANSRGAEVDQIPTTEESFRKAVIFLAEATKQSR